MHDLLPGFIDCRLEYIHWPLSAYRKLIFKNVAGNVKGGDVLDLACGQAGLYWALAYVNRCKTISFVDYFMQNIKQLNNQMNSLSATYIEDAFADTYEFITAQKLIPNGYTSQQLTEDILSKVDTVQQGDFSSLTMSKKFDSILSIEGIECVASEEEFMAVLKVCHNLLREGGQLTGICAKYDSVTQRVKDLISTRFGGALNPNENLLKACFQRAGFKIEEVSTVPTPELRNFSEAITFDIRKI